VPRVLSVSCPSTKECFAGAEHNSAESNYAMLTAWTPNRWHTATKAPLPAQALERFSQVNSMSCPTVKWCTGVGEYYDTGGNIQGLLLRWNGKKWSAARAPLVSPGPGQIVNAYLYAVSCPSADRCFAGGSQSGKPLLLTWSKDKWSRVKLPSNTTTTARPGAVISGISCPSVSRCVAVGSYDDVDGPYRALMLTWSGSKWAIRTAPLPADAASDPQADLQAVSCSSTTHCVAGGTYSPATSAATGLLLTLSGTKWTAATAPAAALDVIGVSCPSATRCFAISDGADPGPVFLTGP
jgi:hypothetical protein